MGAFKFPRADAEVEGGRVTMITDLAVKIDNGAKYEPTFRGGGVSFGAVQGSGSFQVKIASDAPLDAPERKWLGFVLNKKIVQMTFKLPDGARLIVDGAFSSADIKSALEGAVDGGFDFIGKIKGVNLPQ